jgi:hypothetical protein
MEEKKFFVKDFIKYCSPCFGCGDLMTFRLGYRDKGSDDLIPDDLRSNTAMAIVTDEYIEVELSMRYRTNLKVWIYHRNQKVVASNQHTFNEYVAKKELYLYSRCPFVCNSRIMSKVLDFQRYNGIVAPTSLRYEEFHISHKNKVYSIASDFVGNRSVGTLRTYLASNQPSDLEWEMKLLPKYKMITQQKLIDKLDIYAVFS